MMHVMHCSLFDMQSCYKIPLHCVVVKQSVGKIQVMCRSVKIKWKRHMLSYTAGSYNHCQTAVHLPPPHTHRNTYTHTHNQLSPPTHLAVANRGDY